MEYMCKTAHDRVLAARHGASTEPSPGDIRFGPQYIQLSHGIWELTHGACYLAEAIRQLVAQMASIAAERWVSTVFRPPGRSWPKLSDKYAQQV